MTLTPDGRFTYQVASGFEAQDSFTYRAKDATDSSEIARVLIDVTTVPPVSFWLVNAETNQRVLQLGNNDTINITELNFAQYAIEAGVENAGSVSFSYSGITNGSQTESQQPYAMFGDTNSNFAGQALATGSLMISASAFSEAGGAGTVIAESAITISFIDTVDEAASDDLCIVLKTKDAKTATVCF